MTPHEDFIHPKTHRVRRPGILKVTGKAVSYDAQNKPYWHEATRALDNRLVWVVAHYTDSTMCRIRCEKWTSDLYVAYWPDKIVQMIEDCEDIVGWKPTRTDMIKVVPEADLPVPSTEAE